MYIKQNRQISLVIAVFVLFVFFWFIFFMFRSTITITISSDENTVIFISRNSDEGFSEIGGENVTYKTREEGDLYIRVEQNGNISMTSLFVVSGDNKDVYLPVAPSRPLEEYLDGGSYAHPLFDGRIVQGIDPGSGSIINFSLDSTSAPRRIEFLGIPSLRYIYWEDKDNFVYSSFRSGVGIFSDGQNRGNISENQNINVTASDGSELRNIFFSAVSWHPEQPVILLGDRGVYSMNDIDGNTIERLIPIAVVGSQLLFSDSEYIYVNNELLPGSFVSETDELTQVDQLDNIMDTQSTTTIYSYSGEEKFSINTVGSKVIDAVSIKNGTAIILLGENSISITDILGEGYSSKNISTPFSVNRDMFVIDDTVYVLSDDGLWRLLKEPGVLQLVSTFNGIGLRNSMTKDYQNEFLYLGTQRSPDGSGKSAVYRILISDLEQ